jgi:AraC family transcriptional regulator of adaptative response / DNA-3-methyladenine glycosylase II
MASGGLDAATQYQAVLTRDKRYDGIFYFAKKDTRIYCRPSCSTPRQQGENYAFFSSIRVAKSRGLVACKYCHPTRLNNGLSLKILSSIDTGAINDQGVCGLAHSLHISEQHLRRIVRDKTGTSPIRLNNARRLRTAKRLTVQTKLPITEIAFSAGFSSIRQFNVEFKRAFKASPRELRKVASLSAILSI